MTSPERMLIWFLRLTAVLLLSAAAAVVMPYAWKNAAHQWLGLGPLADQPTVAYLTRSLPALYACLGAGYWYVSRDVKRYLPLLRFSVPVTLVFGVTLVVIDVANEMPMWWTLIEGPFLLGWTFLLWWLVRRCGC